MFMILRLPLSVRVLALATGLLGAGQAAQASTCEDLRASIEENIRAKGVQAFSVRVVEASAAVPGRVVGTCDMGARKIVYARTEGSAAPSAAASQPVRTASRRETIITECRDGRVITSGSCPK